MCRFGKFSTRSTIDDKNDHIKSKTRQTNFQDIEALKRQNKQTSIGIEKEWTSLRGDLQSNSKKWWRKRALKVRVDASVELTFTLRFDQSKRVKPSSRSLLAPESTLLFVVESSSMRPLQGSHSPSCSLLIKFSESGSNLPRYLPTSSLARPSSRIRLALVAQAKVWTKGIAQSCISYCFESRKLHRSCVEDRMCLHLNINACKR